MSVSPPPDRDTKTFEHPLKRAVKRRDGYSREQVVVGVIGTLLAHIWFFYMVSLGLLETQPLPPSEDPYREFSIELAEPEEEEEEQAYTETNPDVAENEPDDTNRYAARDQQAANEERPEELDPEDRPAVESDDTVETDQTLTGSLDEPVFTPPPSADPSEEEAQEQQQQASQPPSPNQPLLQVMDPSSLAQRREVPLFGSQEEAEDESGIADYDYTKLDEAPTNVTDLIEGEEAEGEDEETRDESQALPSSIASMPIQAMEDGDGIPSPKARPQLPRLPSAPTRQSKLGVSSVGQLAVDAKASKFGEYMERLIETVKLNWDDLVQRSSAIERKSTVKIRFMLSSDGYVTDIEILEGTTARVIGVHMCRQAIERGSPFGPWPDGLEDLFGREEDITFTFHYY
ncbi:energy transducer TonB [Pelagicoccus sp. NFK12]|uniref:Energy transducer TonB n=1 Tax=Pelagicoccus enzymogenes TaxID=2773457 RepID=A0A927F7N3_9BACT|nr:energy transducer TonB [Pelagicoccus enzymogenes]MBD5779374.1 energy transducer TonB [Pelagicoccus enzymogenes]